MTFDEKERAKMSYPKFLKKTFESLTKKNDKKKKKKKNSEKESREESKRKTKE